MTETQTWFSKEHSLYRHSDSSKLLYPEKACTRAQQALEAPFRVRLKHQTCFEGPLASSSFPHSYDQRFDYLIFQNLRPAKKAHWRSRSRSTEEEALARCGRAV